MKTRKLGYTDLELSVIGVGCWAMGGNQTGWQYSWGFQDDQDSISSIRAMLDHGVNWIDTAAVYGLGHSEEVVAKAIEGRRDEVIIATKCGLVWNEQDEVSNYLAADSIIQECEASLKRLNIDVIDLYQIHWPNDEEHFEEGWIAVQKLIEEGKIRYAGVSNFSIEQMDFCAKHGKIASLQPPYSLLRRQIEGAIMPYCKENEIGIVAYSPMTSGLLTGKWTKEKVAALPDDDFRKGTQLFQSPKFEMVMDFIDKLRPIAERLNATLPQLAIAWVLRRPEMTSAIVGVRNIDQVKDVVKAAEIEIDKESLKEIDASLINV